MPGLQPFCLDEVARNAYHCESFPQDSTRFMVCQSETDEKVRCPVDIPDFRKVASVAVVQTHSPEACEEGTSYWVENRTIWVKGCTATFKVTLVRDEALCASRKAALLREGCEPMFDTMQTCAADVRTFCPGKALRVLALTNAVKMGDIRKREMMGHGPPAKEHWDEWDRPEGRPGRPMPPRPMPPRGPPTPFSSLLVQCMVSHMPELSAACAATPAMQLAVGAKYATLWREEVETRLGGVDFMALLWIPYVAGCVVALAVGVGYFLWQRHRLQRRRGAVARAAQGGWSTGLFHCDVPSCLPSCCCPVFQSALNQAEVHDRDGHLADVCMNLSSQNVLSNTYYTRQALRHKYGLAEEPLQDCLTAVCCNPCANAQHMREMDMRYAAQASSEMPMGLEAGVYMPAKEASDAMK